MCNCSAAFWLYFQVLSSKLPTSTDIPQVGIRFISFIDKNCKQSVILYTSWMSMKQPNDDKLPRRLWKLFMLMSIGHSLLQLDDNQPFFSLKEKCLLWDPDLGPSSPSKLRVLTIRLTHAAQKARTSSWGQPERLEASSVGRIAPRAFLLLTSMPLDGIGLIWWLVVWE